MWDGMNATWLVGFARDIVSTEGVFVYCLLIGLLAFGVYWLGFSRKMRHVFAEMQRAVAQIRSLPGGQEFAEIFEDFSESIGASPLLGPLWREFKGTLVFEPRGGDGVLIRSTLEPALNFNDHTVIAQNINVPFYNAFPNYLTGLGILGTFIGLVAGIFIASHGLGSSDAAELRGALQGLLQGASLAFLTSVMGLISSILFSWREKHNSHRLQQLISQWNENLDRRIERITPEYLGQEQLRELRTQSSHLEEFATQLGFNIAEALKGMFAKDFTPALQALETAVNGLREDRKQTNEQILIQMVEEFKNALSGTAGKEMSVLAESLQSMNNSMAPLLREMNAAHTEMKGTAEFISESIRDSYETSANALSEGIETSMESIRSGIGELGQVLNERLNQVFDQANDKLATTLAAFDERFGQMSAATQKVQDMIANLEQFVAKTGDVVQSTSEMESHLRDSLLTIKQTSDNFQKASESSQEIHDHLRQLLQGIKLAGKDLQERQTKYLEIWRDYQKRFEGLDESLQKAFEEIENGLDSFATRTRDYVIDLDQHSGNITASFGGAVEEFREAIEELKESLDGNRTS